jgi:hypothetical protein
VLRSELLSLGGLAGKQKRLGILPIAADFEGAEVFVPRPIRRFGFGFPRYLQLVEIVSSDLAFAQSLEGGRAARAGDRPTGSSALLTEGHARQFLFESFLFLGLGGRVCLQVQGIVFFPVRERRARDDCRFGGWIFQQLT